MGRERKKMDDYGGSWKTDSRQKEMVDICGYFKQNRLVKKNYPAITNSVLAVDCRDVKK